MQNGTAAKKATTAGASGRDPEQAWSGKRTIVDGFQRHGPKPCVWASAADPTKAQL
ncbi:hypothetical protein [Anoxybacterium hadale]|uniref:hypothetical protein n=1 Tax=Anoxybacterium hadale TaxID=3408580 RepID=UPI003AFFAF38